MNFSGESKPCKIFGDSFKTQIQNFKNLANFFQVSIHFHPCHAQQRRTVKSFNTEMKRKYVTIAVNGNLSNYKIARKNVFRGFNGIRTLASAFALVTKLDHYPGASVGGEGS